MNKVWILYGFFSHEGLDLLRVFSSEASAEKMKCKCIEHSLSEPEYPKLNDSLHRSKLALWKEWNQVNPLGSPSISYPPENYTISDSEVFP